MHIRVFPCAFLLHPPANVHLRRFERSVDPAAPAAAPAPATATGELLLLELLLPCEMAADASASLLVLELELLLPCEMTVESCVCDRISVFSLFGDDEDIISVSSSIGSRSPIMKNNLYFHSLCGVSIRLLICCVPCRRKMFCTQSVVSCIKYRFVAFHSAVLGRLQYRRTDTNYHEIVYTK